MKRFDNEFTYKRLVESGNESDFDNHFETAAEMVKHIFDAEHPIYVGSRKLLSNEKITEVSPIDGVTTLGKFQKGGKEHANQAITEAANAYNDWKNTDYRERVEIFRKAGALLSERKFGIAAILSYENGKTRYEAIGEVDEGIDFMRYYASEMEANRGYMRKSVLSGLSNPGKAGFQGAVSNTEKIRIMLKPYGVFGVIAPFNFPISIAIGMSTGALITGNTVVFKPSCSDNPTMLSGVKIYELFKDAGLPSGVFNYVTGSGGIIGDEMMNNNAVKGIALTGSRAVGTGLLKKSIIYDKRKQFILEMGGKNPAIISKTADLEVAANGIVSSAFGYAGQKCSALSRMYVHESIKEALIGKIIEKARNLKIGNPLNKDVYIGPLMNSKAFERYKETINTARSTGRVLYGGNEVKTGLKGFYVEPAIIEVKHDSPLVKNELFLPVLTVETFKDIKEAIALANDTPYGLTAGFYGKKKSEINEFTDSIESGVIYINREVGATTGAIVGSHTFVGWKESGYTTKGTGGEFYLQQFMKEQSISVI